MLPFERAQRLFVVLPFSGAIERLSQGGIWAQKQRSWDR
jgi:hypothetical protein